MVRKLHNDAIISWFFIYKHLQKDKGSCTKISLFPKAFSFVIYTDIIVYSYTRFHVLVERRSRLKKRVQFCYLIL